MGTSTRSEDRPRAPRAAITAIAVVAAVLLAVVVAVASGQGAALCQLRDPGVTCGPGNGRQTAGGGGTGNVPHTGWPAVTGILWKVLDDTGRVKVGGADSDELLGHHGSDTITGGGGSDILWGDWDPTGNTTHQHDILLGGSGNDFIYPSHGSTTVRGGPGNDFVWAFYGHGTIDCGPGKDTVRVRQNGAFKLKGCETVQHFCANGADSKGRCLSTTGKVVGASVRLRAVMHG